MRRWARCFSGCRRRRCASGKLDGEQGVGTRGGLDDKWADCTGDDSFRSESLREDGGENDLVSELCDEDWVWDEDLGWSP